MERDKNCFSQSPDKPLRLHPDGPDAFEFEATADGTIYRIDFKQKESMEVEETKAALIQRFGKPSKRHGDYLYLGCDRGPQEGFCVKANVSASVLDIWAFDEDVKKAGEKT